ncbi:MAG: hypothetical protein D6747_06520 [Chlorobiota bacterium]|nr:MAG: hypothetical protein D6747_06520 [Chlorobiota bacterium]
MKSFLALVMFAILLFLNGCERSTHDHDDAHKVPGTFILRLIGNNADTITARWRDPDGPGGSPPRVDTLQLRSNSTYSCSLEILATDGDSLTSTIRSQGTEHQFFYSVEGSATSFLTIAITDRDSRGMPLGFETLWTTASVQAPTLGQVRIQLYHYEPNTKDGLTRAPETDADISLPLFIEP